MRRHFDTKTEVIIAKINVDFDMLNFINLSQNGLGKIYRGNIIEARIENIANFITLITLVVEIYQAKRTSSLLK